MSESKSKTAPSSTNAEMNFSGKKFYVAVPTPLWESAIALLRTKKEGLGNARIKEQLCLAKLMQAAAIAKFKFVAKFKKPTDPGHDLIITLSGKDNTVDIKTLYPDFDHVLGGTADSDDARDGVLAEAASAVVKEIKQGNVCCFDISFLPDAYIDMVRTTLVQTYPACLVLKYNMLGTTLQLVWPAKGIDHEVTTII